jgi:hypothetical protein
MVGWNVAQAKSTGATVSNAGTWAIPASGSVTVTFTNIDSVNVRIALEDSTSAHFWCVDDIKSGVAVPWSTFQTQFWTAGVLATGSPIVPGTAIARAFVQVPATGTQATPFNVCVTNITIQ